MAKLFKVWDMTKEGKGVKKDEPLKKPFFAFFEEYFRHFSKLLTAGLLWIPFVILVIPSGLGNVGMYGVARSLSLQRPCFVTSDFFDYIKKNWKQALPLGMLNAFITGLLYFDIYYNFKSVLHSDDIYSIIGLGLVLFIFIVFSGMKYYFWLLMITFDLKFTALYKNSFHFFFINLWKNLLVEIVMCVIYVLPAALWILIRFPEQITVIAYLLILFIFAPGFKAFLVSKVAFPTIKKNIIDPYYEENPDLDIEKRRELGLIEEERSEEDAIFEDRG